MEDSGCKYRDERTSLTTAYDDRSQKLLSWDEVKGLWDTEGKFLIRCSECSGKVTLVDGQIRNGFFRHFHTGERKYTEGRRNTGGGTSVWHHRWQMKFPDQREKQITRGEDRADVLLEEDNLVIEFQKADFTGSEQDTCKKRTSYWTNKGYHVAWVFAWDGGSEFAGYFQRGTMTDLGKETTMELLEYEKLFGDKLVSRKDIEIHFLSMDGTSGFEFIPAAIDPVNKVVRGIAISSYFRPFAPAYSKEMSNVKGKEVFKSHLIDPEVEPIDIVYFRQVMNDAAEKVKKYTRQSSVAVIPRNFTLYELIKKALSMDIKVLIVTRKNQQGTEDEYKTYPEDYRYLIEKYKSCPSYTFRVYGYVRTDRYRSPDGNGYFRTEIYSPGLSIWQPEWAVTNEDRKVEPKEFFA